MGEEVLNNLAQEDSSTLGTRTSLEEEHPIDEGYIFTLDVLAVSPEVTSLRLER